jgi:acetyl-CoA carboxylase biotin carboxyl carrier protein
MSDPAFSDAVKLLIEEFSRADIRELHIRKGDFELFLSTDPAAGRPLAAAATTQVSPRPAALAAQPAPPAAAFPPPPPAAPAPSALPDGAVIVKAPNLGTFYRAPKPGAANYVEVGSTVKAGDELCLIEVMKLFTALRAEVGGTVHAVLVEDGAMVEAGQPLFALVSN